MYKYLKLFLLITIFVLGFVVPNIVLANSSDGYLIKLTSQPTEENAAKLLGVNARQIKKLPNLGVFKVKDLSLLQRSKIYYTQALTKKIEYIEPDHIYKLATAPNDTYYSSQWALNKISAPSAWNTTTGSSTIKIAIVDTGIKGTHEDLFGKVTAGYAYQSGTSYAITANTDSDEQGHGTAVAGAAAAITNNAKGIAGLNWQAQLMPIKVFSDFGGTFLAFDSDIALGIIYAADHGAKIINLSFGGPDQSTTLENAINYAHNTMGAIVVAASGNDNSAISYPAAYDNVIAVGATNQSDSRCSPSDWGAGYGSNYGPELDVVAPGNQVYTTEDSDLYNYGQASGTSIAAPYVSGLASLIWATDSTLTNDRITEQIIDNADKVAKMGSSNFNNEYGYGRINAGASINPSPSSDPGQYHYQWVNQNNYPTIMAGQSYNFTVTVKNTGTTIWYKNSVNLGTSKPEDRITPFVRTDINDPGGHPSHWLSDNRIFMDEETVAPGENATFSFWMSAPTNMSPGTYREYFRLVAEGITWMEDYGIYWDVNILTNVSAYYPCQWISQNPYPTINKNQGYNFVLNIKNTGYATWQKGAVNLGTAQPLDRTPIFLRADINDLYGHPSNWLSTNRIYMQQESVASGETATFSFWMSANDQTPSGTYPEYFRLVADNITWMQDWGIFWNVKVN